MLEITNLLEDRPMREPTSMQISDIKSSVHDKNRVNLYVDGTFLCSLDVSQVVDFHLKIGKVLTRDEIDELKHASEFGKFYTRALEYVLLRPRSSQEIRDYLKRKTLTRKVRVKNRKTDMYEVREKKGYDASLVPLVFARLEERGYIDDYKFATIWAENRCSQKGISAKKMRLELLHKGISSQIIDRVLAESNRNDRAELAKIIAKKRNKYTDERKLIQYLQRLGFDYSDVVDALSASASFGA